MAMNEHLPTRKPQPLPVIAAVAATPDSVASDTLQLDALVSACALIAHADGWVTHEERGDAHDRMRRLDATAVFGTQRAMLAFDGMIARFYRDPDTATRQAHTAIARLYGHEGPSQRLVESACSMAIADGGFDEAERDAILDICDLLDVDPQAYGLVAPGGAR